MSSFRKRFSSGNIMEGIKAGEERGFSRSIDTC